MLSLWLHPCVLLILASVFLKLNPVHEVYYLKNILRIFSPIYKPILLTAYPLNTYMYNKLLAVLLTLSVFDGGHFLFYRLSCRPGECLCCATITMVHQIRRYNPTNRNNSVQSKQGTCTTWNKQTTKSDVITSFFFSKFNDVGS